MWELLDRLAKINNFTSYSDSAEVKQVSQWLWLQKIRLWLGTWITDSERDCAFRQSEEWSWVGFELSRDLLPSGCGVVHGLILVSFDYLLGLWSLLY